jgi:hypothetical protein
MDHVSFSCKLSFVCFLLKWTQVPFPVVPWIVIATSWFSGALIFYILLSKMILLPTVPANNNAAMFLF